MQQMAGATADPLGNPLFKQRMEMVQSQAAEALGATGRSGGGKRILTESGIANQMAMEEIQRTDQMRQQMAQMGYGASGQQAGYQAQLGGAEAMADQNLAGQQAQYGVRGSEQLAGLYERGAQQELGVAGSVAQQLSQQDIQQQIRQSDLTARGADAQAGVQKDLYAQLLQQGASKTSDQVNMEQQIQSQLAGLYGTEASQRGQIALGIAPKMAAVAGASGTALKDIAIGSGNARAAANLGKYNALGSGIGGYMTQVEDSIASYYGMGAGFDNVDPDSGSSMGMMGG